MRDYRFLKVKEGWQIVKDCKLTTGDDVIAIAGMQVDDVGNAVITPYGDKPDRATQLAVFLRKRFIRTLPEFGNCGPAVTVTPGQLPELLGIMVAHGFNDDEARRIAAENGVQISRRTVKPVDFALRVNRKPPTPEPSITRQDWER